eukprot:4603494-Pleurochrysis_carterae.AAC.1
MSQRHQLPKSLLSDSANFWTSEPMAVVVDKLFVLAKSKIYHHNAQVNFSLDGQLKAGPAAARGS